MSGTSTPNLGIRYLDPSQAQPEVKFNEMADKIDAAVADVGGKITVREVGDSPAGDAFDVIELQFVGGTVEKITGGIARVTLPTADSDTGGGGGGGGGNTYYIGGAINVDSHPATPSAWDDEFEGAALDTAGTRFTGANPWVWGNQAGTVATLLMGAAQMRPPISAAGDIHSIEQPVPGGASWTFRARVSMLLLADYNNCGFVLHESATGRLIRYTMYHSGSSLAFDIDTYSDYSTSISSLGSGSIMSLGLQVQGVDWFYIELKLAAGNYIFSVSATGLDNTFTAINTTAITAYFTTAADFIGLHQATQNAGSQNYINWDWFRRMDGASEPSNTPLVLQGTTPTTVGALPAGSDGDRAFVTDALLPTFGSAVAGSGAVHVPVYYDGGNAAWYVG